MYQKFLCFTTALCSSCLLYVSLVPMVDQPFGFSAAFFGGLMTICIANIE